MISLLIVLSENVLHMVFDFPHAVCNFLRPSRNRRSVPLDTQLLCPSFSLNFLPVAWCPLIRCSATVLSPHSCTVVPSVRTAIDRSSGSNVLGSFLSPTECYTPIIAKVAKSDMSIPFWHLFRLSLHSSCPANSEAILSHTHPLSSPSPFMLPSRMFVWISHHISCFCIFHHAVLLRA